VRRKSDWLTHAPGYQNKNALAFGTSIGQKVTCAEEAAYRLLIVLCEAASGWYLGSTIGGRHDGRVGVIDNDGVEEWCDDIEGGIATVWTDRVLLGTRPVAREGEQGKRFAATGGTGYCVRVDGIRITLAVPYSDEPSRLYCAIDFPYVWKRGGGRG